MTKTLDIVFVNTNSAKQIYQDLADKWAAIEPPTWSLLLAESCRSKGYGVSILDAQAEQLTHQETAQRIVELKPRFCCFVTYGQNPNSGTTNMVGVYEVAKKVKEISNITTISIGSHTSALPYEVLQNPNIDLITINEGVYALHKILAGTILGTIPGVGFKEFSMPKLTNGIGSIVPQERMDVDLPGYAWDLLPYKEKPFDLYRAHLWHAEYQDKYRTPFASIYTSLGCKFKCITGNTLVNTIYGKISIKELSEKYSTVPVYTYDKNTGEIIIADAINIKKYGQNEKLVRVHFDDGTHIDCTPDHKFYTFKNGNQHVESEEKLIEAKDLKEKTRVIALKETVHISEVNHKVIKVEYLSNTQDVYCLTVPGYDLFFANDVLIKNCEFCMINIVNRTDISDGIASADSNNMRFWSPEFIIKEFDKLINYGIKTIRIADEMFYLNKSYYEPLLKLLKERGYGDYIRMWSYTRIDTVNERFLDLFRDGGIKWLAVGIEAANQEIRKEITKGKFKNVNIRNVVRQIQDHGLYVGANYIFGHPEEKLEHMQETLDLSLELNTEFANFYTAMALPGSPLYYKALEHGWELPTTPEAWAFLGSECQPLPTNYLTPEQVLDFRDNAWEQYFTNPEFLSLIETKFGIEARETIQEQSKTKLKRRILA